MFSKSYLHQGPEWLRPSPPPAPRGWGTLGDRAPAALSAEAPKLVVRTVGLTSHSPLPSADTEGRLTEFCLEPHPKPNYTLNSLKFLYGCVCVQPHVYVAGTRTLKHELQARKTENSLSYLELNPDTHSPMIFAK